MDRLQERRRYFVVGGIVVLLSVIWLARLFFIQVIKTNYKDRAESNALRQITMHPDRGLIYDRNDSLLVYNEAAYDLMLVPNELRAFDTNDLCRILEIDKQEVERRIEKARKYSPLLPSVFAQQISKEDYGYLQEKLVRLSGFFVQNRTLRSYPVPIAAHILGYVGEVNQDMIDRDSYYQMGDYIGISGIEKEIGRAHV